MPGYGNSMGSMSFRNRGMVSSRKEDWEGAQVKPLWNVVFSDGTKANLRGDTIQEVINLVSDVKKIVSIKKK